MAKSASDFKYTIETSREKVWDLIGRAIFDSLGQGLSKMKVIDENNFRAELLVKVFGVVPIPMKLRGEITDITPPDTMRVKLTIAGLANIINAVMDVNFRTKAIAENKTEVHNWATVSGLNPLIAWALIGQVKGQAKAIFTGIQQKLKEWI